MNTSAIQQAIKLFKHPQEMQWMCERDAVLPEGITDLLRLCSSDQKLIEFVNKIYIDEYIFRQVLIDYINKVLLSVENSHQKQLGLITDDDIEKRKLHYKLLMMIFHPDKNTSSDSQQSASRVTRAYNNLKNEDCDSNIFIGENIQVSYKKTPSQTFYHAAKEAQQHISYSKNAFIGFSSIAFLTLLVLGLNVFQADKPQLVISKVSSDQQKNTNLANNNITLATLSENIKNDPSSSILDKLLHQLESAYEKGDVAKIKPILENTPDIRNQSDAEINAKLETLFKITNNRKMLLFNFNWKNISGSFYGEGKFLSRYVMMGEDQWLTREGNAYVTAELGSNNQLKVINLQLKDGTIEQ